MKDNFGRVVSDALHRLDKERNELKVKLEAVEKERDKLQAELDDAIILGNAARNAHAILARGIKKALKLKNWPDFYKMYGDGLFATGVVRLLNEKVDAKNKRIKELENKKRRKILK